VSAYAISVVQKLVASVISLNSVKTVETLKHRQYKHKYIKTKATTKSIISNGTLYFAKKHKVFPYSLPRVGPGADPGVQAVSPQVT